ncbi:hypothetical protein [Paramaledivibacter caminithermalis]|jgi:hypothetical protein|uniref:Uncharacterized protein n=1 Tax=Paramaledivibacter caminithermalis (strain DSM 15212 / CIP 107654 / DViRD3) TaxID=1121301 RepID=A0A1M6RGC6_PARC5|nr:hypothetical protein [Paramaledivibacter caminithermalis]SHK31417.1 hypothetical protein SAMN02745912_02949 [Paramaledivibacter caminithermalis DSM 15212]
MIYQVIASVVAVIMFFITYKLFIKFKGKFILLSEMNYYLKIIISIFLIISSSTMLVYYSTDILFLKFVEAISFSIIYAIAVAILKT